MFWESGMKWNELFVLSQRREFAHDFCTFIFAEPTSCHIMSVVKHSDNCDHRDDFSLLTLCNQLACLCPFVQYERQLAEYQEKTSRLQRRLTQAEQRATTATQQVCVITLCVQICGDIDMVRGIYPTWMLLFISCAVFSFSLLTADYVGITAKENSHGWSRDCITVTVL